MIARNQNRLTENRVILQGALFLLIRLLEKKQDGLFPGLC